MIFRPIVLAACLLLPAASSVTGPSRHWIDRSAGVSITFPGADDPRGAFTPLQMDTEGGRLVIAMYRALAFNPGSSVIIGETVCMVTRRYEGQGAELDARLTADLTSTDEGRAASRERCERFIYSSKATDRTFYGSRIDRTDLGPRETCVAAYTLREGEFPRYTTQMTTFAVGDHGYELQCLMAVRSDATSRAEWQEQARTFNVIRDSIARTPAD